MPAVPRELADLPYAGHLEPLRGELETEGVYDTVHAGEREFLDARAGGARFVECAFTSVAFEGGRMRRARFTDVWCHTVRWVGTDLAESGWMDASVVSGMLAGVQAFGSTLRRVTFSHCKLDSVNWRSAALREVRFEDCLLRDVDFGEATLTDVSFSGSTLDGVRLRGARLSKVDLRGAAALGVADGVEALRGATIDHGQLLDLAPAFAQALGVTVTSR
ncbi:pentapeptide repeat-containing protein [Streptomyces abyssomicinicus]|uniref:pentapeptide repeat-containing protein n=1 Tax=Streptomyces abyssomicinicus TaxID=574929 RepID=UPI00124FAE83|nr:pentapeptide repeat-containing protein [Streptomyces abyssomicinicus]